MDNIILINAVDPGECRIARVRNGQLEEFHIETTAREITKSNIYKGIITRVEPSLQAVFVEYGAEKQGFLQKEDIHSDYFLDNHSGESHLSNMVKKGQELFVQITKDTVQKKGAMLTTFISLPGRHVVLMPGSTNLGVSRKIEDEAERKRLKDILNKIKIPEGFGVIVRTVGEDCTKSTISKDLNYLLRIWQNIKEKGLKEKAPVLLYKERNLAVRSIRDYYTPDVTQIIIDDPVIYHEVKTFIGIISPKDTKIVKLHKGGEPIFAKYKLEDQISSIFESKVNLKSGGSIVIEQTEALVSIDVNSGKATKKHNVEETALQTNLEAAEEIVRQLKLRDFGGLIVIDFIDMKNLKHKAQVEKALKNHFKSDKARTKLGRISKFGLMELSRQRIRPSIEHSNFVSCDHCQGRGVLPSIEMLGLGFLRKLRVGAIKEEISNVRGIVPVEVADYLLNKRRKDLIEIEKQWDVSIKIEGDSSLTPGKDKIICE